MINISAEKIRDILFPNTIFGLIAPILVIGFTAFMANENATMWARKEYTKLSCQVSINENRNFYANCDGPPIQLEPRIKYMDAYINRQDITCHSYILNGEGKVTC